MAKAGVSTLVIQKPSVPAFANTFPLAAILMHLTKQGFLILAFGLIGCLPKSDSGNDHKSKVRITFEIRPEGQNAYSIAWEDTLGKSEGYLGSKILRRPKEIWCLVTNTSMDTLGVYKGLSTARTFTYFDAIDSVVTLNFSIGLNLFSDKFEDDTNGRKYWKENRNLIVFEPITLNLDTSLRRKFEVKLGEK